MVAIRWQYFHIFYVICYFEHLKYLITFNAKSYKFFCRGLRPPAPTPLLQVSLRAPPPHHSFISSLTPLPSLSNSCSGSFLLLFLFYYISIFILQNCYINIVTFYCVFATSNKRQPVMFSETYTQNRDTYPKQRLIPKTETYTQNRVIYPKH